MSFLPNEMPENTVSKNAFLVPVSELALGLMKNPPDYVIPPIQRGYVWNATRCEVLWDSILRGIPIGAISLRSNGSTWEIFDGQQRATAIAMGYSAWPPKENNLILWIDLNQTETAGRQFVFRVTTAAHPWGYNLSEDERNDNRLATYEQRDAVDHLNKQWEKANEKGARPFPSELWPIKAGLPIPFSVLREYVEKNESPDFEDFAEYCRETFKNNWVQHFLRNELPAPACWEEVINAIRTLSQYTVVAVNASRINPKDLSLYFTRMNKQGVVPDNEEINYSLLKFQIPALKEWIDNNPVMRWTRPSWMADIALRVWLSRPEARSEEWKWRKDISRADIDRIVADEDSKTRFSAFVEKDFPQLLKRLEEVLTEGEDGLLPRHMMQLYRHGGSDSLVVYFLRELDCKRDTKYFRALATVVPWFSKKKVGKKKVSKEQVVQCVKCLWDSKTPQEGLAKAIHDNYLVRIFSLDELREWRNSVTDILERDDWGDGNRIKRDPYIGPAIEEIWNGFNGGAGCELLLYSCRAFMKDYFGNYNTSLPEWQEQNRPWDYDHILPKSWVSENSVPGYTSLVQEFLWSIGNSAPLPFSLNREKQATAPTNYPDGDPDGDQKSAKNLQIELSRVNEFEEHKKRCRELDRDKDASSFFIKTTIDRIVALIEEWYTHCGVGDLMNFDEITDERWKKFEEIKPYYLKDFGNYSVWFVSDDERQQCELRDESSDRFRRWLLCGVKGTIQTSAGTKIKCIFGVASNGEKVEIGIRRHPDETSISGYEWWYMDDNEGSYKEIALDEASCEGIIDFLSVLAKTFKFSTEVS